MEEIQSGNGNQHVEDRDKLDMDKPYIEEATK